MKDDEAIKLILDIKTDNIKQERELFKHVAILSSAIVGVFVFNGNFELGQFAQYGVIGLFIVIILSVILLYIILRIEREQVERARLQINKIKEIRNNSIKEALFGLVKNESLKVVQGFIKHKNIVKSSVAIAPVLMEAYNKIKEGNRKITEEKNRYQTSSWQNALFPILASVSVVLFVASLIAILVDVFFVK